MTQSDFIPAGRTTRISKSGKDFTLQTEYAARPNPRLTTSVFTQGQVIYKIENELAAAVESHEQKEKVERLLQRQHAQALEIARKDNFPPSNKDFETGDDADTAVLHPRNDREKLQSVDGVQYVVRVDNDGNFESAKLSEAFRRNFAPIFKHLHEILDIFAQFSNGNRERGVYEVEVDRLYLVSTGKECYFVLTKPTGSIIDYARELETAIS
jgi:hypothetical protein